MAKDTALSRMPGGAALALLGTIAATALPASAEPHLSFGTLHKRAAYETPETYGFVARDTVRSLNSLASGAALRGHEALELAERGPVARATYLLTAGQLVGRFQWANSTLFGHEFMHFASSHAGGRDIHYFMDSKTGATLSNWQAWRNIFLRGEVGGPAKSVRSRPIRHSDASELMRMRSVVAGLNWQMAYTETRLRDHMLHRSSTVFDAPEFLLNRLYTLGYTAGDSRRSSNGETSGDAYKWARYLEDNSEETNVLKRAAVIMAAANLLSPGLISMAGSVGSYIAEGNPRVADPFFRIGAAEITLDVPQYINPHSLTVAPMIYWRPGDGAAGPLGADAVVFGIGAEFAALGKEDVEARATIDGTWGDLVLGMGLAAGSKGAFVHVEARYNLSDSFAIAAGGAVQTGTTLMGTRDHPGGSSSLWAGARIRF